MKKWLNKWGLTAIALTILGALTAYLGGCNTASEYPVTVTKTPVRTITTVEPVTP